MVGDRSRLRGWQARVFVGLFGGYTLLAASRAGISIVGKYMILPAANGGFGFAETDIGKISSAFTAAYGLSKFMGGVASDLVSCRLLFSVAILCAGISN